MLKKIRIALAIFSIVIITLLFLDFTGAIHKYFGWLAKIQFLPALLALNTGVIIGLLLLTLIFGRIYCSVICPLGIFQDTVSWIATKTKKNRFKYKRPLNWLRYLILGIFILLFFLGLNAIAILIAPYSAYGRIASNLFAPVYYYGNDLLATVAERFNSYTFYSIDIWIKSLPLFIISIITLIVIVLFAWFGGRNYCNMVCPVGTFLGFLSKYSWFKPIIDDSKCISCGLCARKCKASCIDPKSHKIDYSRCVACMDCLDSCSKKAISFSHLVENSSFEDSSKKSVTDDSRRKFLTIASMVATSSLLAKSKKVDGGLAIIEDKQIPNRKTQLKPAGSFSIQNFSTRCTACQLCVSACPNGVLRPSSNLEYFMQPEMQYEIGYCRPECTECSQVCPAGAITLVTPEDKSSIQIGHAVWIKKNCVVITDNVSCGNCARHCPVGAIKMIAVDSENPDSLEIPMVNSEICI